MSILLLTMIGQPVQAEESSSQPDQIVLHHSATLAFQPQEAFFLIDFSNKTSARYSALRIPSTEKEQGEQLWHFLLGISIPPHVTDLTFTVFVTSASSSLLLPLVEQTVQEVQAVPSSVKGLQGYLIQRQEILRRLETQLTLQREQLERLRADAEIIGRLGRIVKGNDTIETVQTDAVALQQQADNLQYFLDNLVNEPQPQYFAYRKRVLAQAVTDLAEHARAAEAGEGDRKVQFNRQHRKQKKLLQEVRVEDLIARKRELARLQAHRIALEEQLGVTVTEEDLSDYAVW